MRALQIGFVWCFLAGLALVAPLTASELTVSGRVVDENNTPVANVRIALRSDSGSETVSAVSSNSGTFAVLVHPGTYFLSANCEGFFGFQDRRIEVTESSETLEVAIQQVRQTSESINVSATAPTLDRQDTTSERHLTGRQLIDVPYPTTRDFRSALRIIPGVLRHPSGRLSFDGGMEDQVFYSLNGFNISDPITNRFTTRLPVEAVRSIDYVSGRYSPEFGKGSAGSLAIQTTTGGDVFRYSATNFVPGIDMQKGMHIGTWSPRFNLSGPIRRGRAWFSESVDAEYSVDVIQDLPKGQDRTTRWRGSSVLHGQVNVTPSQILSFDVLGSYENAPRNGISVLDPVSTSIDYGVHQYFASVKDQMYLARGMILDVGYAYTTSRRYERPQGSDFYIITPNGRDGNYFVHVEQKSRRDQFLINLYLPSFQAAGTHQLKTGIDLDIVQFGQNSVRTGFENYDLNKRLLSRTTFAGPNSLKLHNTQASSYIVDAWNPHRGVTIEYGLRQDWDELVNRLVFSPRVSVAYSPFGADRTTIAGGYAVVHDASSLSMFARSLDQYSLTTTFSIDGTPLPVPATTYYRAEDRYRSPRYNNVSLGLEQRITPHLRFSASFLRRRGVDGFTYAPSFTGPITIFELTNSRRDAYDAVSFTLQHAFGKDYGWMMNYTRSRGLSNAVVDLSVDQPLRVVNNLGRQSWDVPNRLLSWGYLPGWNSNWAFSYLLDVRTGFPFSVVRDTGEVIGGVNSFRFPVNVGLNLHIERKFRVGHYRFALRGGVNNVTNSMNASGVNNVIDSPHFLQYYGREGRHAVFRLRWLKPGE